MHVFLQGFGNHWLFGSLPLLPTLHLRKRTTNPTTTAATSRMEIGRPPHPRKETVRAVMRHYGNAAVNQV